MDPGLSPGVRRTFRLPTDRLMTRASRTRHSSALPTAFPSEGRPLILVGVDSVKGIRDTHVHPVSDDVLTRLAAVLTDQVRAADAALYEAMTASRSRAAVASAPAPLTVRGDHRGLRHPDGVDLAAERDPEHLPGQSSRLRPGAVLAQGVRPVGAEVPGISGAACGTWEESWRTTHGTVGERALHGEAVQRSGDGRNDMPGHLSTLPTMTRKSRSPGRREHTVRSSTGRATAPRDPATDEV
jgi:hypothetical protein